jgi:HD-GYP domain-containing protein (c-di-GMP phosphodiesterase class II)
MEDQVRLVEVLGAMGLATDLAMGMPFEHSIRSTIITARLSKRAGLPEAERALAYYLCLMMFIGCTADLHFFAGFMGDEHAARMKIGPHVYGNVSKMMRAMISSLGSHESGLARLSIVLRGLSELKAEMNEESAGHCEVAQMLSGRLAIPRALLDALPHVYERWDGKGMPGRVTGEQIPRAIRVMHVGRDVDTQLCLGGGETVDGSIRSHAGSGLDPTLASIFLESRDEILAGLDVGSSWDALLEEEPGDRPALHGDDIDESLRSIGEFTDIKTPFTLGRSAAVSALADAAADARGFSVGDRRLARRAALVCDLGRVCVPVHILEQPGPLNAEDLERLRLHTYYSERVLARSGMLGEIGAVASLHHERLDGSGYHRGVSAGSLSPVARIVAAADAYRAMIEPRPHRPALDKNSAEKELRREADAGHLDPAAVDAVLQAAGGTVAAPHDARSAALTDRELQVLRLLAQGLATKQIARRLSVSSKTVDNHLQRIYPKLGVTTRAGATLYAARAGLLA